jgi:hypothetical protein
MSHGENEKRKPLTKQSRGNKDNQQQIQCHPMLVSSSVLWAFLGMRSSKTPLKKKKWQKRDNRIAHRPPPPRVGLRSKTKAPKPTAPGVLGPWIHTCAVGLRWQQVQAFAYRIASFVPSNSLQAASGSRQYTQQRRGRRSRAALPCPQVT